MWYILSMSYDAQLGPPLVRTYDGKKYTTIEVVELDVSTTDFFTLDVTPHCTVTLYESTLELNVGGPTTIDPELSTTTPFGVDVGGLPGTNKKPAAEIRNFDLKRITSYDSKLHCRNKPAGGVGNAARIVTRVTWCEGHHV